MENTTKIIDRLVTVVATKNGKPIYTASEYICPDYYKIFKSAGIEVNIHDWMMGRGVNGKNTKDVLKENNIKVWEYSQLNNDFLEKEF